MIEAELVVFACPLPFGLPRLIEHFSCEFAPLEEFETHDEPDAWKAVRTGGDAAP